MEKWAMYTQFLLEKHRNANDTHGEKPVHKRDFNFTERI